MSDPITLALIVTTALSAGASIFGGVSKQREAAAQSEQLQRQAEIEREETKEEIERKTEERTKFIARQKVAFLASGIGLAGSSLIVLEDTFQQFNKEIASVQRSGAAKAGLLDKEAKIRKKSGKASLIGGVLGAGSTIAGNIFKAKES